jgi:hypothetical protein
MAVNGVTGGPPLLLSGVGAAAYVKWSRSSVANGYIGSADAVAGGNAADFGVSSAAGGQLVFAINNVNAGTISTAGAWNIPAPSSGAALTVNGVSGALPLDIKGVTNSSYLRLSRSGTANGYVGSADSIVSGGATTDFGICAATSGALIFGVNGNTNAGSISTAGAWTIPAPSSGDTFTAYSLTNNYSIIAGILSSSNNPRLFIQHIESTGKTALKFSGSSNFNGSIAVGNTDVLTFANSDEVYVITPPAASAPPAGSFQVGYIDIPHHDNPGTPYTLALTDRGKTIYYSTGTNTLTIPANGSIAFPTGTAIRVINLSGNNTTINITTDSLTWLPSGSTGSRTLANNGACTLEKVTGTAWIISGVGLT